MAYKIKKVVTQEPYFTIEISADANDADYIAEEFNLNQEDFDKFHPLLHFFIKNYGGSHQFHKWNFEYIDEKDEDMKEVSNKLKEEGIDFEECSNITGYAFLPFDSDYGVPCHTLGHVSITYTDESGVHDVYLFEDNEED